MSDIVWTLEKRKLKDLKPFEKNPRKLTDDQAKHLQASLDRFGLIDRPFINLDGTIIGGHQRIKLLGRVKELEVMVPSRMLTEKEVEELNIRHNKNTGEFDWDILANEFEMEDLLEYGFTPTNFEMPKIGIEEEEETKKEEVCPACNQKVKKKSKN